MISSKLRARELQVKLMQKDASTSGPIKKDAAKWVLEVHRIYSFRLTCMIAEMNKANKEYDIALRLYKEANSFDPNNSKVSSFQDLKQLVDRLEWQSRNVIFSKET